MNITVLGANGAIGQTIVEEAVQAGHQVLAVARREGALDHSPAQEKRYGNLTDKAFVQSIVADADLILSGVGTMNKDRKDMSTPVADGLAVLLEVMQQYPEKRVVLIGAPTLGDPKTDKKSVFTIWLPNLLAKAFMPAAYRDLKKVQNLLANNNGNWTVVRFINPNVKTDGKGYAYVMGDKKAGFNVSRKNIAQFMLNEAHKPEFKQQMPIVFNV